MFKDFLNFYKQLPTITSIDVELIELFNQNLNAVSEHFDCCFVLAGCKLDSALYLFHKGFRQYDVCENSKADMVIWSLLADGTKFFSTFNEFDAKS